MRTKVIEMQAEQFMEQCVFCKKKFSGTPDEIDNQIKRHVCKPLPENLYVENYAGLIRCKGLGKMLYVCPNCFKAFGSYNCALDCKHLGCPSHLTAPTIYNVMSLEIKKYNTQSKENILEAMEEKIDEVKSGGGK